MTHSGYASRQAALPMMGEAKVMTPCTGVPIGGSKRG